MKRFCFVCHGNICRSVMAEFIFKALAKDAGRTAEFAVCSAATHSDNLDADGRGADIYPEAKKKLREKDIPFAFHASVLFTGAMYENSDAVYCMDEANLNDLRRMTGGDPQHKICLLLNDRAVSDPWYTRDFERAYQDILGGCKKILEES